ncbi:MAG: hypothetical protein EXQ87_07810 [Alphaproteobacteria bacterium]|nr:hypothetical protein [Alphaproteobacteria bacterium]
MPAIRMSKRWTPFNPETVKRVPGQLGVYQLANAAGEIVYVGVAGGRSLFGLRGELQKWLAAPQAGAAQFRIEVNMSYRTRHLELLMAYRADHEGRLPAANTDIDASRLGRLSPA